MSSRGCFGRGYIALLNGMVYLYGVVQLVNRLLEIRFHCLEKKARPPF